MGGYDGTSQMGDKVEFFMGGTDHFPEEKDKPIKKPEDERHHHDNKSF